ncbi:PREDICTED: NADH dehydrogenase [ubiquinone] 1 alpha subcomplex subunit 5, partial [Ceratosolen solmsi marchali]|uniref:NADH dehydrogenase [ubiquinone] 1 alpha subcomplex subunit 5 n=1 Tax=Ceratosolen solmsi marchali TaxID=326594 RepID=A0AAJ6YQL0_9HYME
RSYSRIAITKVTSQDRLFTTGLCRLEVHKYPRPALASLYKKIMRYLQKLPNDYPYRLCTEKLIQDRAEIINNTESEIEIEKKIGWQMEELIFYADEEFKLIKNILECKCWESINNENIVNQWSWPPHV